MDTDPITFAANSYHQPPSSLHSDDSSPSDPTDSLKSNGKKQMTKSTVDALNQFLEDDDMKIGDDLIDDAPINGTHSGKSGQSPNRHRIKGLFRGSFGDKTECNDNVECTEDID